MNTHILLPRVLAESLPLSERTSLVVLTGARQTGKTTLAQGIYPDLNYINLDAPENREFLRQISTPAWSRTIGNAVIDEAQKEPLVFDKVKYAFDQKAISFTVLLGSSQILLLKKIRESLAGRVAVYELWPLMMSELTTADPSNRICTPLLDRLLLEGDLEKIFSDVPPLLLPEADSQTQDNEDYLLQWGGMPALLPLAPEERWKWLKDYYYTYLERDLADLARLDDLQPFTKFKRLSALRSGKLLNYSELARDAGVSVDTARRYLEYLRLSYQVVLLQPYYKNLTSTVIKTPKLYWVDIGILRHVSGQREGLPGELYETMVVSELYKWIKTTQRYAELFFYRTRSGREVDVLLENEKGVIGIEIKARSSADLSDAGALKNIATALQDKWQGGVVIYRGNEIKKIADPQIWAVPSRRLFT